ncbi:extracellular solute-binding protein (plasmid) [Rahnella variigena]|jgi:microcin C transport system substrate-binding protein|uniref:extracellular solute-binding protein n=1 Tax=Rahnella TaxID=34037 RepID=UPI000DE98FA2|nr:MULTISPECIES: extracellular solute-binding protein [Rahnella]MDH2895664.1 extracellular solute-binding protein [Rahnella variigena]RBQ34119.1 ABC transporter substrate-binding protein [Rahnella aquatilis]TCQ89421.1 microcin C transport system substrate-binding protein [Rahnella sp. JUb53]
MFSRVFAGVLCLLSLSAQAEVIQDSYAFAILGEPKYVSNFTSFDYVNPAAPKGGQITLAAIGTYDNFNRFASRGNPAARSGSLYDSLFTTSSDEIGSYYPLIADSARYDSQYRWVEVDINPRARFNDNTPITASDVAFSFKKFMTEGVPQFRVVYKGVEVKAISRLTVRMVLPKPDKDMMLGLLGLPVLPQVFWEKHKFNEPLSTPPPGSGPYRISDYKLGQYITYSRVPDYWAANLPVNRGRYNFDTIRYDYYLDDNVALEAFKSGAFDFRMESSPKNWATQYQGGNFSKNFIVKADEENQAAQDTRWLAFNLHRPQFADRKVREAITLAFDFDWMNKALYFGAYQRVNSYFQNTEYAAKDYPNSAELAWLGPLKGQVPAEVFTSLYQPPRSDGSGNDRANLLKATALLKEAGWEVKDQVLVNSKTGKPFTFELLLPGGGNSQYVLPFQHNLQRLGIKMSIREVDNSQFVRRMRQRDYDMIPTVYPATSYPSSDLRIYWNTQYLDSTYNKSGISDPAIDKLTDDIAANQGKPDALLALGHALDRVLTWNRVMIPMWYTNHERYAYWDKFSMPAVAPSNGMELDTWWYDVNRAARLPAQRR